MHISSSSRGGKRQPFIYTRMHIFPTFVGLTEVASASHHASNTPGPYAVSMATLWLFSRSQSTCAYMTDSVNNNTSAKIWIGAACGNVLCASAKLPITSAFAVMMKM